MVETFYYLKYLIPDCHNSQSGMFSKKVASDVTSNEASSSLGDLCLSFASLIISLQKKTKLWLIISSFRIDQQVQFRLRTEYKEIPVSKFNQEWTLNELFFLQITGTVPYRYICWVNRTHRRPSCISKFWQFPILEPLNNRTYRPPPTPKRLKRKHGMQAPMRGFKGKKNVLSCFQFMQNTLRLEYEGLCILNVVLPWT